MPVLKTLKDGRVALIFETEQVSVAAQIFSVVVGGNLPKTPQITHLEKKKSKTLEDIKAALKASTPKIVPTLSDLNGFDAEKAASEICTIISDKQLAVFGNVIPQRYRTFYSELEQYSGTSFKGYKAYVGTNDKREYPYRKIDYVLTVLPREYVYDFAKNFKFKTVGACVQ